MTELVPVKLHAKLSASGSEKWMTCTPSMRMEEQYPDTQTDFSREGTFAHDVFENMLKYELGMISSKEYKAKRKEQEQHEFWSNELLDHVLDAHTRALERVNAAKKRCKDPVFMIEQRLDFSPWVPEGFGTGDLVIITDDLVEVLDLKYGKGIYVDGENNSQMRLYALGAYNQFGMLYDINRVRTLVLQPRLSNYTGEELAIEELLDWAENKVAPAAKLAWNGEGELVAGDHCVDGFCRARFTCPKRAEAALAVAQSDFALTPPELLSMEQIADILPKADLAIDWLNDIKDYALKQAAKGNPVPGHKLVEGRSKRVYSDANLIALRLKNHGFDEAMIYERSLLGITAMEKLLGKAEFTRILGDLISKPSGKPTLVPDSDKRPAITVSESPDTDFS